MSKPISPYGGSFERCCESIAAAARANPATALPDLQINDDNGQPIRVADAASEDMLVFVRAHLSQE